MLASIWTPKVFVFVSPSPNLDHVFGDRFELIRRDELQRLALTLPQPIGS